MPIVESTYGFEQVIFLSHNILKHHSGFEGKSWLKPWEGISTRTKKDDKRRTNSSTKRKYY